MSSVQEIVSGAAIIVLAMAYFWKRTGEDPSPQQVEYQRQLLWGDLALPMAADEKNRDAGCLAFLVGLPIGLLLILHGVVRWF